ncbi:TPA: hypothetical protein QCU60_004317 [Bacillus cereus]|nr:hypothetical protein [Bacillus cereus]HDR6312331.1 hypothetical protein [Bacillus cereus]
MQEYQQALLFDDYRDWKRRCKLEKRLSSIIEETRICKPQQLPNLLLIKEQLQQEIERLV